MSANTKLLSADNVKKLYTEGGDKYECKHFGCRNKETANAKHKKCGKCGIVNYCSRECQITDWPQHKKGCRQWRNQKLEDKNSTTNENDGFKRIFNFSRKYSPLCCSIAQHLFPIKTSRKGTIAMIYLQDLPEDCKFPRMEIESVGRADIKDIPGDFGTQCLQSVNRERKLVQDRGNDPNDVICALLSHPKTTSFIVLPFVLHDDTDPFKGTPTAAKTVINQFFDCEVDRIVRTINSLARGESKDLKSAKKCPAGPK